MLAIHGEAKVSNTFPTSVFAKCIFHATAVWLVNRALAVWVDTNMVRITDAGRVFVQVLDAQKTNA